MEEAKIGENRLIPKGTKIWSIANQATIMLDEDVIATVKQTCFGGDAVFVEPKQLLFNMPGYIPTLIGRGDDEWTLSYSKTLPYTVPEPQFSDLVWTKK